MRLSAAQWDVLAAVAAANAAGAGGKIHGRQAATARALAARGLISLRSSPRCSVWENARLTETGGQVLKARPVTPRYPTDQNAGERLGLGQKDEQP